MQRVVQGRLRVGDPCVTDFLGITPGLSNNTVMGFDHSIGYGRVPFACTHGQDCDPPVAANVSETIRKIPLPLAA